MLAVTPFTVSTAAPESSSVNAWPTSLNGDAALVPSAATSFAPVRLTFPVALPISSGVVMLPAPVMPPAVVVSATLVVPLIAPERVISAAVRLAVAVLSVVSTARVEAAPVEVQIQRPRHRDVAIQHDRAGGCRQVGEWGCSADRAAEGYRAGPRR